MKRRAQKVIAMALILSVGLLSGCMSLSFVPSGGGTSEIVEIPESIEVIPDTLTGDSRADQNYRINLHYISSDQPQLTPVARVVRMTGGDESLAEIVMERLLEPSGSADGLAIAPVGTRLLSIEVAQRIATVNLSIEASEVESDQRQVWMRAAITNTLTEIDGIDAVNVLIGGMEESVLNMPIGTLRRTDGNLTSLYARYQADEERLLDTSMQDAAHALEREVTLYFPTHTGDKLLPEVRTVRFEAEGYIETLIKELAKGPTSARHARATLPEAFVFDAALEAAPEIVTTDEGLRLITLSFAERLYEELEKIGVTPEQLYGALTLTLCRFVPEINGLVLRIGGVAVVAGEAEEPDYMTPTSHSGMVNSLARLYFTAEDGKLAPVDRAMDPPRAQNPRGLLEELIAGPQAGDGLVAPVVPEGITGADILGVRVEAELVMINLSSNFYRCCQSLSAVQERNLIYSIVNTLTELNGIRRVRFYVDDDAIDTMVKDIFLRSPLIRNPGLIADAANGYHAEDVE